MADARSHRRARDTAVTLLAACGDVLTKKKLDPHRSRCHGASFTCIDCMVHFQGVQYRSHTSCITEDQKYQGALYKEKNKKQKHHHDKPAEQKQIERPKNMAQQPYVEDVGEDREYEPWNDSAGHTEDERSPAEPPPEAPTPPAAATEEHVNVFDFLVATGQTPNASNMNLPRDQMGPDVGDSTSLVRYEYNAEEYLDPTSLMDADNEPLVQYGTGPVPSGAFVTPASKSERRKTKDSEVKKDKKRKRLHVEVPGDQVMTDAPPVLHSGLTGGLKTLMRPTLPPSPDYSGGDVADNSPASPLKKTKHSKHAKSTHVGNSLFDMITGGSKSKSHKKKSTSKKKSHGHKERKEPKLIEFRPQSKDGKSDNPDGQMVVFKPRADAFLSFVNKGPESERGCSVNKALKRYHRERQASGTGAGKSKEEKELWKDLRLRRNERGEIVLFSISE
ncbi:Zinc finger domain-containing protein, C2H2, LYAR-type [Purpureocillium lilacinum]|uniref:Zinc finger domain-containing protein, C2H2, LYAR-type n=1 Tax=Purpureocillium lilacinum TaxID=33203 RepID=A0A179HL13_PURLI|nr:Zinc finger domain-containing protein, C2H2, LYAR-type [Purpureocillium lilacinum]OAQ84305.1 Zinc finger domain-containing protein, C2H2, LYAR-type [Purpureocillium lilacinum]OAQ91095.1 Zinc finger domain-containing protein, C2H2, LYAR-type [Purpureocillium lilacinum]